MLHYVVARSFNKFMESFGSRLLSNKLCKRTISLFHNASNQSEITGYKWLHEHTGIRGGKSTLGHRPFNSSRASLGFTFSS